MADYLKKAKDAVKAVGESIKAATEKAAQTVTGNNGAVGSAKGNLKSRGQVLEEAESKAMVNGGKVGKKRPQHC